VDDVPDCEVPELDDLSLEQRKLDRLIRRGEALEAQVDHPTDMMLRERTGCGPSRNHPAGLHNGSMFVARAAPSPPSQSSGLPCARRPI
jgi:hypothetical protein